MKNLIVLLLALIMVLACVACGNSGSTSSDTTTAPSTNATTIPSTSVPGTSEPEGTTEDLAFADPDLEAKDFDGTTLTFLMREDGEYKSIAVFEDSSNSVASEVYWRNQALEEKYKIKIACTELHFTAVLGEAQTQINSDELAFDILDMAPSYQFVLAVDRMLYDMAEIPVVDSSKGYWLNKFNEEISVHGINYFLASYANLWTLDSAGVVFFNTELAEELQLGNLYELVMDYEWTYDVMNQMSQLAYKDDGDGEWDLDDRFGSVSTLACVETMYVGMGGTTLIPDGEDYRITYTDEENIDRLTKIVEFWAHESSVLTARYGDYMIGSNQSILAALMLGGRALFAQEQLYQLSKFADSEYVIGMLPIPLYDENQENYRSATHYGQASTSSIPLLLSENRLELVGTILEDMAFTGWRDIRPAYYDVNLKFRRAQDEESREILDIIFENTTVDLGTCFSNTGFTPAADLRAVVRSSNTAVSSYLETNASAYALKLEELLAKLTASDE